MISFQLLTVVLEPLGQAYDNYTGVRHEQQAINNPSSLNTLARRSEGATEWTEQPNGLNLIRQLANLTY
jgi:hypothetical protein